MATDSSRWDRFRKEGSALISALSPSTYGWVSLIALVVICMMCYFSYTTWPDRYTAMGFYVSVVGFSYTIYQLMQTKVAAEKVAEIAKQMTIEHYRQSLEQLRLFVAETNAYINAKNYKFASWRLRDVSLELARVKAMRASATDRLQRYEELCVFWAGQFRQWKTGRVLPSKQTEEWETLERSIQIWINEQQLQFSFPMGV